MNDPRKAFQKFLDELPRFCQYSMLYFHQTWNNHRRYVSYNPYLYDRVYRYLKCPPENFQERRLFYHGPCKHILDTLVRALLDGNYEEFTTSFQENRKCFMPFRVLRKSVRYLLVETILKKNRTAFLYAYHYFTRMNGRRIACLIHDPSLIKLSLVFDYPIFKFMREKFVTTNAKTCIWKQLTREVLNDEVIAGIFLHRNKGALTYLYTQHLEQVTPFLYGSTIIMAMLRWGELQNISIASRQLRHEMLVGFFTGFTRPDQIIFQSSNSEQNWCFLIRKHLKIFKRFRLYDVFDKYYPDYENTILNIIEEQPSVFNMIRNLSVKTKIVHKLRQRQNDLITACHEHYQGRGLLGVIFAIYFRDIGNDRDKE